MKNKSFTRFLRAFAVAVALLLIQGCASNGYISSSITTGIGLDVSENSQTQIPHIRFGYIRHGLYYIPTGKTGDPTGDVTKTPHVVSKIHVSSEFLKGITISEKFAVGDNAGNSAAAAVLFADTSTERTHAPTNTDSLGDAAVAGAAMRQQVMDRRLQHAAALELEKERTISEKEARQREREQKEFPAKKDRIKQYNKLLDEIYKDAGGTDELAKPVFEALLKAAKVNSDPKKTTMKGYFGDSDNTKEQGRLIKAAESQRNLLKKEN